VLGRRPKFHRFVADEVDPDSQQRLGVFQIASRLRDEAALDSAQRALLAEHLAWFDAQLSKPDRFVRSRSKGFYRRQPIAISWFKADALECIERAAALVRLIEAHGIRMEHLTSTSPGYIVYEDHHQIVAVPFKDRC
jgi:hypothetical protein